jgi:hypothetical protein
MDVAIDKRRSSKTIPQKSYPFGAQTGLSGDGLTQLYPARHGEVAPHAAMHTGFG